jgi:hypothetical protein
MNTIRFNFDDLCAFFSRYSSRLMVGMISTDGEAPEHVHQPHIIIIRNGVVEREYHTWDEINGDICLEMLPEGKPLSRYVPQSPSDWRRPYSMGVDLEKDLHPNEDLQVDPSLCRARIYFKNGELYSIDQVVNARFLDVKTGQPCDHAPTEIAVRAGLDVEIPENGYARLRFFNGTEDFIFQTGSDYEVRVTNLAEAITGNHFRYFYNIARSQPERMWYLAGAEKLGLPTAGLAGDIFCNLTQFGLTIWEWLMGSGAESTGDSNDDNKS